MSEHPPRNEAEPSPEAVVVKKLEMMLQDKTGEVCEVTEFDGTYEIDADTFFLTFTIKGDLFEIRSIEARGEAGLGGTIVGAIKEIATEEDFNLIASNVLDNAIGFWRKMNFEPTNIDGEYIWENV